MDVTDTKPLEKCCSKCNTTKIAPLFIPKRNICKECRNIKSRENYNALKINMQEEKQCNICNNTKIVSLFIKNRKLCIECNNNKRKLKYKTDEEHRIKMIKQAVEFKQKRIIEKRKKKEEN